MSRPSFVHFARPSIGEEEVNAVVEVLRSGWLTTGRRAAHFEKEFGRFIGARNALAVNSATAGLHLALEAVGVQRGDAVITTPYTFTATAEVVAYLGADVVFADVDGSTLNIDVSEIARILQGGRPIRAVVPVHFGGQSCEMTDIMELKARYGFAVVEDAAHALPATHRGSMIGTIGDITAFSFYVTKTLATGEGGMVTTDNDDLAQRMRVMRLHGIDRDVFQRYTAEKARWYYEVIAPGYKYNMTDIAAAIGIEQLRKVEHFAQKRARIAERYNKAFEGLPLSRPTFVRPADRHAWHLYVIKLQLEHLNISRDRFIELLAESGIGASVHFIPLHLQPYWRDKYALSPASFPVATDAYERAVSLPIYPAMDDEAIETVIEAVTRILTLYSK
jgi:dTDP-4-amino-4,6-dideoxygalactose transaminase